MPRPLRNTLFVLLALVVAWSTMAMAQDIRVGLSNEPTNMDPHIQAGTSARAVRLLVYRGLFNYNGADGARQAELVESYDIADDDVTYTFNLKDTTFSNGDPVTAEDVQYSLERILDDSVGASFQSQFEVIESIDVVDEDTVRVTLREPTAPFLDYLALPEAAIVNAEYVEETGGNWTSAPVGAGPYRHVEYRPGQHIVIEARDDFYKADYPVSDRIVFEFYADSSLRMNALRNGDVNLIEYVAWRDIPVLERDDGVKVLGGTGPFMGLIFNVREGPFSDPRVRRAVSYAIDRQVVIDTAFSGQGEPIYGMNVPENSLAYDPRFDSWFEHDPERARELLAEAGYADGFTATMLSTGQYDFHMNTAIAVQSELAKVGIDLELDLPDWATRLEKNLRAEYEVLVVGTAGDISDPDFLSDYYRGGEVRLNNAPGYQNEQVEELLDRGRSTLDADERQEIYHQLQEIVLNESPLVYLMWRDQSYAASADLQGFEPLPGFLSFQSGIMLERAYLE